MCNLHWCYTFCTGVTLFAPVLHLNCTALNQSESSNFFMCIISTKTYFFVHQHYLVTVVISSMIHWNKRKKITRCFKVRWNWYTQFHSFDSHFNWFFPTFISQVLAVVSYLVVCISWSFHGCCICCCLRQPWKYYENTNDEIKGEDSACRVYFHWSCTSVFPNNNLMSSQRPIFNWLREQTIKLLSI